jgi:NAD(P)-dependent dehydrogenase (short-subunit alcohol dehydrogenase family)
MTSSPLIVLITGANAGLGYHTARHLASQSRFHVLVGARSTAKAEEAIKTILSEEPKANAKLLEPLELDLTSDASIDAAAAHVAETHGKIDVLVNNAAIPGTAPELSTLRKQLNATFDTNVAGTALVTEAFIPLLKKSNAPTKRIVMVSSGLGSLTLTHEGKLPVQHRYIQYSVSKAALNMLALYTLNKVKENKIAVLVMSPGYCATKLNNFQGFLPPEEGALKIVETVTKGDFESTNGKFFGDNPGSFYPW